MYLLFTFRPEGFLNVLGQLHQLSIVGPTLLEGQGEEEGGVQASSLVLGSPVFCSPLSPGSRSLSICVCQFLGPCR